MKKFFLIPVLLFTPMVLFAQSPDYAQTLIETLAPRLSLWSAIIVAFATSIMVFLNAHSMKGGLFGTALNYFASGMMLILAGFIAVSFNFFESEGIARIANNILFILGYITMGFAAHKLSQIAQGK